ncbi:MAG: AbrB/MazE/SpoVT family DNA-binding domain-containing protein [Candidatus Heimdallarchaeota archaeon]
MTEIFAGQFHYGTVKVGERGQVVIPSEAREHFNIKPGDRLIVFGHRKRGGLILVKAAAVKEVMLKVMKGLEEPDENEKSGNETSKEGA